MKGIYQIRNIVNNKIYIGSSKDIIKRFNNHTWLLRNNKHNNLHLQHSWNMHGANSFVFEILLLCEEFELLRYEQWYLDNVVRWKHDYNISKFVVACFRGRNHTDRAKNKISKKLTGRKLTKETKNKMSTSKSGEQCYNSKLTKSVVATIREMYLTNDYTQKELGKIFNVPQSSISGIVNYKRWKYT